MITPLSKIRDLILEKKLDAILVSSVPNILYLTNYSGFSKEEREAFLLITKNSQYIITDSRYSETVKKIIPEYKLMEISPKLTFIDSFKLLIKKHNIKKMGFEGHDLTHLEYIKFFRIFKKPIHVDLTSLRSIKTATEIIKIENACKIGDKTFDYILKKICLGISEEELALEIEFFIKKNGADISFPPIVAFGKNSANPHHIPTNTKLTKKQIILLDFGAKLNSYCSDMTRTIFFGKPTEKQKHIYETVLKSQSLAIENLKSLLINHKSLSACNIDKIARNYIISKGYPSIPHSLGHSVGIQIHESPRLSPRSKDILREGMVFSIEPGIYIPNFGGVRIEDLVVLEKTGLRLLTCSPKKLISL